MAVAFGSKDEDYLLSEAQTNRHESRKHEQTKQEREQEPEEIQAESRWHTTLQLTITTRV